MPTAGLATGTDWMPEVLTQPGQAGIDE